jgi:hypothetical protein
MPISPFSDDGQLPADIAAIRYCESTIRRSSSFHRVSLLSDRSMAPPVLQCFSQRAALAVFVSAQVGRISGNGAAENAQTSVMTFVPRADTV